MAGQSWRALVAALSDDRAREVYALIVLGQPVDDALARVSAGKRSRVLESLWKAGLIVEVDGHWRAEPGIFRAALAEAPAAARPTGVERFFSDGRLSVVPSRASDREAVLTHVAARVMVAGEVVSERVVTERLATITDDPALLRRQLVDGGFLSRRRDGSAYSLAG